MQNFFLIANTPDGESSSGVAFLVLASIIPFFIFLFIFYFAVYFYIFSIIDKKIDEEIKRFRNSIILSVSSIVSYLSITAFGVILYNFNMNVGNLAFKYGHIFAFLLTAFIFDIFIILAIFHKIKIKIIYKLLIMAVIYFVNITPFLIMLFFR